MIKVPYQFAHSDELSNAYLHGYCAISAEIIKSITKEDSDVINPGDIHIETWPPQTVGGQHVGLGGQGVKVTHAPTGITVTVEVGRSQHRNRMVALDALAGALTSPHLRS